VPSSISRNGQTGVVPPPDRTPSVDRRRTFLPATSARLRYSTSVAEAGFPASVWPTLAPPPRSAPCLG
jgi:hypothetical protein